MEKKKNSSSPFVYSTDPNFKLDEDRVNEETIPADQQPLRVKIETKHRAGKAVTIVDGFIGRELDLEALGKKLKSYCGTGGSAKDRIIIIQGDQRVKVLDWLIKNGFRKAK